MSRSRDGLGVLENLAKLDALVLNHGDIQEKVAHRYAVRDLKELRDLCLSEWVTGACGATEGESLRALGAVIADWLGRI